KPQEDWIKLADDITPAIIESKGEMYGFIPTFKAGCHYGRVIAGRGYGEYRVTHPLRVYRCEPGSSAVSPSSPAPLDLGLPHSRKHGQDTAARQGRGN
ncbi:MAG: hypothetical protein AAB393_03930, partial [Bacteroidota bacterium]